MGTTSCGWVDSTTAPSDPHSSCSSHRGITPLPLSVGRTYDLLLTNKIWPTWQDVTSMITFHKTVTSTLKTGSLPCWIWWSQLPYREAHTSSQQGSEILSPKARKELNLANNHINLEEHPSPVEPSDGWHLDCNLVRNPEAEDHAGPCPDSWLKGNLVSSTHNT